MSEFSHVVSNTIRDVLELRDTRSDAIADALKLTANAAFEDANNREISYEILGKRVSLLEDAEYYWNDEGDVEQTIEALRNYWRT